MVSATQDLVQCIRLAHTQDDKAEKSICGKQCYTVYRAIWSIAYKRFFQICSGIHHTSCYSWSPSTANIHSASPSWLQVSACNCFLYVGNMYITWHVHSVPSFKVIIQSNQLHSMHTWVLSSQTHWASLLKSDNTLMVMTRYYILHTYTCMAV